MNEETLTQNQYAAQEQPTQETPAPVQEKQETEKEQNMRYFRERAEMAERRAQELENLVRQNMAQQAPRQHSQPDEDSFDIEDDSYIEGKHLKKYVQSLRNELQQTKKQQQEFIQQNELQNAERQLKAQFSDFDQVVNGENLKILSQRKPALYRSIISNPDIYDKGYAAYEIIKNAGIGVNEYAYQDKKIDENKSKPRSATSYNSGAQTSDTPLTSISNYDRRILSEERKEQLRRQVEMAKQLR